MNWGAFFASFLIPGLGQIATGRVGSGILWFIFVAVGYFLFVIPGLVLHIACAICALDRPKTGTKTQQADPGENYIL